MLEETEILTMSSSKPNPSLYGREILVPGDISSAAYFIAAILATEKVSIKNIGIIHNREFEDGVLKIEFYTDAALEQAKVLLTKRNYKICER